MASTTPAPDSGVDDSTRDTDRSTGETGHPADDLLVSSTADEQPTLSVVMPTMNEEEGVAECITRAKNAIAELEVTAEILLSDASSDRTPEIGASMGAIVLEPDRPGYGYAYRYAFDRARGDYIVMGDADTTYDFEEIPKLFRLVASGEADIAMGSRLEGNIRPGAMPPLHQYVGNPLLTRFLNAFYDAGVSDAHSGFRLLSREALETLDLKTDGMEFASEMIMDAGAKGLNIVETPITYHEREGEAKLESFRDGWRHVKFMLVNAPGFLFSIPGIVSGAAGSVLMLFGYLNAVVLGQPLGVNTLIAGSLLVLVGHQIGSFGFLSAEAAAPIRRPADLITEFVLKRFTLERGALVGASAFLFGGTLAAFLVARWVESGYTRLPPTPEVVVAFTFIVLGMQTLSVSFFGHLLSQNRD
ncbi:glycosyltransferase family 2 protein [Halobaculum sp. P14]|uniref:glycosyltransferase family 2 protein n=1 Tax=Halobaculum sp. P14 TaxID=3421638 RepID=UPI003EB7E0D2